MNKAYKWLGGVGATITGLALTLVAHAQTAFVVPSSTASGATAFIGTQFADAGTLTLVAVAIGIPLFFYVVHQVMGLLPKSRAGRRA
jgi:hypothetical protein